MINRGKCYFHFKGQEKTTTQEPHSAQSHTKDLIVKHSLNLVEF